MTFSELAGRGTIPAESTAVTAMWRGVEVLRPIAWVYAAYTAVTRHAELARPGVAWAVLGVLGAWTVAMVIYRTRNEWVVGTELLLGCIAILSTRLVDLPEVIISGAKTVPGFWPAAAVVAWAVLRGWRAGVLAATVVATVDLIEVGVATENTVTNIVILVLLGGCIGSCADLARDGHAALSEALRVKAEMCERERLARKVHDGVLQTLAYIHRCGVDLGGEFTELGMMAADQERQLRAMVSGVSAPRGALDGGGAVDLRLLLASHAEWGVNVIPPAEPVLMAPGVASELAAAVDAALDNVRRHAGAEAQAWVLIEDHGKEVTVTVRDNGVGVLAGRLAEAAANGRMGMANSIRGRMNDLGGTVTVDSRPGAGTSLELTVTKKGVVS